MYISSCDILTKAEIDSLNMDAVAIIAFISNHYWTAKDCIDISGADEHHRLDNNPAPLAPSLYL
jgi:hypothetical protein